MRLHADLLAVRDPDPAGRARIRDALSTRGFGGSIDETGEWLVAARALGTSESPRAGNTWTLDALDEDDRSTFAVRADGSAEARRSAGGAVPLYQHSDGRRIAFSTRLDWMAWFVVRDPRLDELAAAALFAEVFFPERRTIVDGVRVVPPGHLVDTARGDDPVAWWTPRIDDDGATTTERAARFRELLEARLAATLDPEGGNLLTLSGGVDSTVLGIVSARLGFDRSALSILPTDPAGRAEDERFIAMVSAERPLRRRHLRDLDAAQFRAWIEQAPEHVFPVTHPTLLLLPEIASEEPVRVLFGGEFADEVVGSHHLVGDWVAETGPLGLLAAAVRGGLPGGPRSVAGWMRRRLRGNQVSWPGLPPGIRADLAERFASWRAGVLRRWGADPEPRRHLRARLDLLAGTPEMSWDACSREATIRSFPFRTRKILELALRTPASGVLAGGSKGLLRAAYEDRISADVLKRPKPRVGWTGWEANPFEKPEDPVAGLLENGYDLGAFREGLIAAIIGRSARAMGRPPSHLG